jgi:hypothetical protein
LGNLLPVGGHRDLTSEQKGGGPPSVLPPPDFHIFAELRCPWLFDSPWEYFFLVPEQPSEAKSDGTTVTCDRPRGKICAGLRAL